MLQLIGSRSELRLAIACIALTLSACAARQTPQAPLTQGQAQPEAGEPWHATWQPMYLPGKRKTQFTPALHEGRQAVRAFSQSSVSMLRRTLRVPSQDLHALKFSWHVPSLIKQANMAERDSDDSVVRIVLAFEGDRSRFSAKNRMLSELSHVLTGEELPYATLMYVWCNTCQMGDVIINPRTDRIRKLAIEAGTMHLGQWRDYERDIRADFVKAFGEEPGALQGIALMTDTDNTQSQATAWYGPVSLKSK